MVREYHIERVAEGVHNKKLVTHSDNDQESVIERPLNVSDVFSDILALCNRLKSLDLVGVVRLAVTLVLTSVALSWHWHMSVMTLFRINT